MSNDAYSLDELVKALKALRFDSEGMERFRDRTVMALKANPTNRACINEAIWLVKVPVLHTGVWGTPLPLYKCISDYTGGGPEDDFTFERVIKLHEELG